MIVQTMQQSIFSLMDSIHQLPFNVELAQGALPKEKFIFYLYQDALYLTEFSKSLAITGARLSDLSHSQALLNFAVDAIQAETTLHQQFLHQYENILTNFSKEQSPACFMYTNYLLKMASLNSVEEAVASLLPCFWVYREVGNKMRSQLKDNHPYEDWITLYAGDKFDLSVQRMVKITNELGDNASYDIKQKMIAAFIKSTQLEYLFWHSAYCQEEWNSCILS